MEKATEEHCPERNAPLMSSPVLEGCRAIGKLDRKIVKIVVYCFLSLLGSLMLDVHPCNCPGCYFAAAAQPFNVEARMPSDLVPVFRLDLLVQVILCLQSHPQDQRVLNFSAPLLLLEIFLCLFNEVANCSKPTHTSRKD